MKIWKKILLGFMAVILIMILVDYNALRNNIKTIAQVNELELSNRVELAQSNRIAYQVQRVKSNLRELFLETEADRYKDEINYASQVVNEGLLQIEEAILLLEKATQVGVILEKDNESEYKNEQLELLKVDSLKTMISGFTNGCKDILRLQAVEDLVAANKLFEENVEPVSRDMQEIIQILVNDSEEEVIEAISTMGYNVDRAIKLGIYLTALSVLLSVIIALLISKSISSPLNRLVTNAYQIGRGNFESKVYIKTGDEIELLGNSFNQMADELKQKISSIDMLNKNLTELNDSKDTLLSIIAHDLKNPFNIILGYAELLASEYDSFSERERKKMIGEINKSSKVTFELLENLLTWARSQSGKIILCKEQLNLQDIVSKSVEAHVANADYKNISINNNLPDVLNVYADKFTLSVVINNLLANAIKFTNVGGQVSINAKQHSNQVELEIEDTGIGIDKDTLKGLFKPGGKRLEKGTIDEKGTGLGLVLVKDFIQQNGGKIWVKSKPGVGSLFGLTIPQ